MYKFLEFLKTDYVYSPATTTLSDMSGYEYCKNEGYLMSYHTEKFSMGRHARYFAFVPKFLTNSGKLLSYEYLSGHHIWAAYLANAESISKACGWMQEETPADWATLLSVADCFNACFGLENVHKHLPKS